eukprot:gb/GEZN01004681.1/.p1 GENE.gb/GEZN01004681.1/~~gb/GEZN01004681.1/.p1  ORF type:complete len:446 (+),score=58.50 gb/GEZN01004681.1/:155-1492(+)
MWAALAVLVCLAILAYFKITSVIASRHLAKRVKEFVKDSAKHRQKCLLTGKRALVFVNPHGGSKSAMRIYQEVLLPMSRALGLELDLVVTQHQGHCLEVTQKLAQDPVSAARKYAVVVCISGDGMLHEAINGLSLPPGKATLQNKNPGYLLALPLSALPGGSSNGVATSLAGADAFEAVQAFLLGRPSPVDLYSVQKLDPQTRTRCGPVTYDLHIISFGLVADHNHLAERTLRWIGKSLKELLAPLIVILQCKQYACRLLLRPVPVTAHDKLQDAYRAVGPGDGKNGPVFVVRSETPVEPHPSASKLPDREWWEDAKLSQPGGTLQLFCASNLAWGSGDTCFSPGMNPASGFIDVLLIRSAGRLRMMQTFLGLEKGEHIHNSWLERYKVDSFVLIPLLHRGSMGKLDVSGEPRPTEPVVVDVLPGAALFWFVPPGDLGPGRSRKR